MATEDTELPDYDQMDSDTDHNQPDPNNRNKYGCASDESAGENDEDAEPDSIPEVFSRSKHFTL